MNKALLLLMCLFGAAAVSSAYAAPMSLDLTSALNYDSVGTSNEINYVDAHNTSGNRRLTDILGGHNLANAGRAFTNTASLSSGTALPTYGVVGNFIDAFTYDNGTGSAAVSNSVRLFASSTSSTTVTASTTITLDSNQQLNYNDLNFLFVQDRSAGAGTFTTTVTVTYTDGTSVTLDNLSATVVANGVGGTLGSAGVNGQGGLSNSTDTDTTVTNVFSSTYGVITSGSSGNETSVISSAAGAGTNLWQLTTPLPLNSAKVLKSVTLQVQCNQAGQWNELVVFGVDADMTDYTPPPASDPTQSLNVTFDPGRLAAHPRLMITPSTLPTIKAFYNSAAGAQWKSEFQAYVGSCVIPSNTQFLVNGTEAQRQAFWRLPTVALDYLLNGTPSSLTNAEGFLQLYVSLPDWETDVERNSGLSAANNMVGVALAYDWLYNYLDPTFRETVRQKLFAQARAMYYGGYLLQNSNIGAIYWQDDPLNNHRWARADGLALAVMASYTGDPSQNYMLNKTAAELSFLNTWLPPDGSHHESVSYMVFGANHLTMNQQASDDCLGTNLLGAPFFQNVGKFRIQASLSDFNNSLDYGDFGGAPDVGSYNNFLLKVAAHNNDLNLRAATVALYNAQPGALDFAWFSLLWDNSSLTGGSYQNYPLTGYYSNMGVSFFRDSWTPGGIAAMFKCAPLGGVTINQYRDANSETYINVAHDDPDANSFIFFSADDYLAASDQYSQSKESEHQNTVLINSKGQNPVGRSEPQVFDQPATSGSMQGMATSFAPVTTSNGVIVSEGEAAGSYPAISGTRPAISRYRRLFMWAANKYILVLDDLRSATSVTFTSLVQAPGLTTVNASQGLFTLTGTTTKTCPFQVTGSQALNFVVATSTADNMSVSLNYKQLQTSATGTSLQLAAAYDPWQNGNLRVALQNPTTTTEDIAVTGNGVADTYRWTFATSATTASSINLLVAPSFTSGTPPAASINTSYSFNFSASGYPAPTFSVPPTALPPGLSLSSAGALTGSPTQTGTFPFTVTASNGFGTAATQNVTITVYPTYAYWAAQEGLTGNNAQESAIISPDGITNITKYALGLDPHTTYNPGSTGLPVVKLNTAGTYLTLTFTGVATDVTYTVQASSTLAGPWATIYTYKGAPPPGTVVVQDTQAVSGATQRYMRLETSSP